MRGGTDDLVLAKRALREEGWMGEGWLGEG